MQSYKTLIIKLFFTQPVASTSRSLGKFIKPGDLILDLGTGSGVVASEFSKKFSVKIQGVDVADFRVTNVPLKIFDGKKLPFTNKHFDHVLLSFVLHHTIHPEELLTEAKRVTKKYIFIYEETPSNTFYKTVAWWIHSFFYSLIFGSKKGGYHDEKSWIKMFSSLQMKVLLQQSINWLHPLNLVPKTLFVLQV